MNPSDAIARITELRTLAAACEQALAAVADAAVHIVIVPEAPEVPRVVTVQDFEAAVGVLSPLVGTDTYIFVFYGHPLYLLDGIPWRLRTPLGDLPLFASSDGASVVATGHMRGRPQLLSPVVEEAPAAGETQAVVGIADI